jgi:uncharacterized protein DUF6597
MECGIPAALQQGELWDNGAPGTTMRYLEIKPNASAARFVKCYWLMEDAAPLPNPQRIVPDGRAQLILNLAHPYEALTKRGWRLQPQCFSFLK